jgi:hypothetical protein
MVDARNDIGNEGFHILKCLYACKVGRKMKLYQAPVNFKPGLRVIIRVLG